MKIPQVYIVSKQKRDFYSAQWQTWIASFLLQLLRESSSLSLRDWSESGACFTSAFEGSFEIAGFVICDLFSSHTRHWRFTLTFKGDMSVAADSIQASAAVRREINDETNDAVH